MQWNTAPMTRPAWLENLTKTLLLDSEYLDLWKYGYIVTSRSTIVHSVQHARFILEYGEYEFLADNPSPSSFIFADHFARILARHNANAAASVALGMAAPAAPVMPVAGQTDNDLDRFDIPLTASESMSFSINPRLLRSRDAAFGKAIVDTIDDLRTATAILESGLNSGRNVLRSQFQLSQSQSTEAGEALEAVAWARLKAGPDGASVKVFITHTQSLVRCVPSGRP